MGSCRVCAERPEARRHVRRVHQVRHPIRKAAAELPNSKAHRLLRAVRRRKVIEGRVLDPARGVAPRKNPTVAVPRVEVPGIVACIFAAVVRLLWLLSEEETVVDGIVCNLRSKMKIGGSRCKQTASSVSS